MGSKVKLEKAGKAMVHVYLSPDEKSKAEEAAKKLGLSLSSYIKVKLFSKGLIE